MLWDPRATGIPAATPSLQSEIQLFLIRMQACTRATAILTASSLASSCMAAHSLCELRWCGASRQPVEGSQSSACRLLPLPAQASGGMSAPCDTPDGKHLQVMQL